MELNNEYYQIGKRVEILKVALPDLKKLVMKGYAEASTAFSKDLKLLIEMIYKLKDIDKTLTTTPLPEIAASLFDMESEMFNVSVRLAQDLIVQKQSLEDKLFDRK